MSVHLTEHSLLMEGKQTLICLQVPTEDSGFVGCDAVFLGM